MPAAWKQKIDITRIAALTISCVLIVFNFIRIFNVPMTIDETGYDPGDSYRDIMLITNGSSNTHILHSIIRKFLVERFSTDIFFFRVDSLVAQMVFQLFSYKTSRLLFANRWWALLSFCILNVAAPLIFDFWGLSRGYSLSLAFMTASIYYLLRYIGEFRFKFLYLSLGLAMLAAYSNFGYLNYFLTLCALIVLHTVIFRQENWKNRLIREVGVLTIAVTLLGAMVAVPFRNIYDMGQNVFLGQKGFIEDTVTSLVRDGYFLNSNNYRVLIDVLVWVVVIIAGICGVYWAYVYFKGRFYRHTADTATRWGVLLYLLLMVTVASLVAQHVFFNINYLIDRTALFFIIFFVLQLIYMLYYLRRSMRVVSWSIFILLVVVTAGRFISCANTQATYLWWFDRDDLVVLKQVATEQANKQTKIKLGVNWMVFGGIRYDIQQYYPGRFEVIQMNEGPIGKDTSMDYYYIASSEINDTLLENYEKKGHFVGGGFALFKKK